ncbi:hypothetical protein [Brevundimonas variabilis]|uniref:Uncharacterized protein n=1 Tax=Brevundimonas variabilis TaxID=74312 RepID=A0A7W9FGX0_9CAUL|nr:hypothetical protein [Brevundimonas variabilis]MBB5746879.1 hypothetical protein [Brevundimonas variabilis]
MRSLIFATLATLSLGSIATATEPLNDLSGRQMTVVDQQGERTVIRFESEGIVRVTTAAGDASGRWKIADRQLCFEFEGQETDCWPWDGTMPEGTAVPAYNGNGPFVLVTLEPALDAEP